MSIAWAGIAMLAAVGVVLLATGWPAWTTLIGVAGGFALVGAAVGVFDPALLAATPARILGLFENDLLQALPLYVLMGALIHRLPFAEALFRVGVRIAGRGPAAAPLSALGLAVLLAPMNGSVGAGVMALARLLPARLAAAGVPAQRALGLVCAAGTLGVVVPPSLVLILLSDAMMRAHTEALNATGRSARIVNSQDILSGALLPAAMLLLCYAVVVIAGARGAAARATAGPSAVAPAVAAASVAASVAARRPLASRDWMAAGATVAVVVVLQLGVTLGYLFAVEAAATGAVALWLAGFVARSLDRRVVAVVLADTLALSGALLALLVGATFFTLVLRGFGTDRLVAELFERLPGGAPGALFAGLGALAACALVLDAFELIFVVVPVLMPPLLARIDDPIFVAVATLLILQASFVAPPLGYAFLLVRGGVGRALPARALARGVAPFLAAQALVLALVIAVPALVWHRNPATLGEGTPAVTTTDDEQRRLLEQQLAPPAETAEPEGGGTPPPR